MELVQNCHVQKLTPLATPQTIKAELSPGKKSLETLLEGRNAVKSILQKQDI